MNRRRFDLVETPVQVVTKVDYDALNRHQSTRGEVALESPLYAFAYGFVLRQKVRLGVGFCNNSGKPFADSPLPCFL